MLAAKISSFGTLSELFGWAAGQLVDLGDVSHVGDGFALISPDDDASVKSLEDFNWFRDCIVGSLPSKWRDATVDLAPIDAESHGNLIPVVS